MQNVFSARRARTLLIAAGLSTLALIGKPAQATTPEATTSYLTRPEVLTFISDLQSQYGFEVTELERILGDARHVPVVVRLIGPPPLATDPKPVRNWPRYRSKFLSKNRINAGVRYWQAHEGSLRRAELEYGVPAEVILGILGVETAFGRNTGSFRVIDALATIAFDGPRRQEYFREELKELLLLARETGRDPLMMKGSYAGAIGLPQFMPSSYRKHAVDFDGDGIVDLAGSPADAIASIAKYLQAYGWTTGEPARVRVTLPKGSATDLVSGLQRDHTVAGLKKKGVKFSVSKLPKTECSVYELPNPRSSPKYMAGFGNFEAVTRYNRSTFYASAVLDLADAIKTARKVHLVTIEKARAPAT